VCVSVCVCVCVCVAKAKAGPRAGKLPNSNVRQPRLAERVAVQAEGLHLEKAAQFIWQAGQLVLEQQQLLQLPQQTHLRRQ